MPEKPTHGSLRAAVSSAISAATSPVGLDNPANLNREQNLSSVFLPASSSFGETCWIPAADGREAQSVIDEIVLDRALIAQRRTVPIAFEAIKEVAQVRAAYIDGANVARANWEAANKVLTPDVAEMISKWRDNFRLDLRRRYPLSGFVAKSWEVGGDLAHAVSTGNYVSHADRVDLKRSRMLAAGKYTELIESALKTNPGANRAAAIARSTVPIAKALAVGSTIVTAAEIPYRVYRLQIAKNDNETQEALARLIDASAAGAIAAACIAVGVTTGGIGFLACGVAPVAAGIFAGDAALAVRNLMIQ